MNYATRFTKLALLLIVAGTLALAGCGGDDGVSQSVHDQLQMEKDAEEAARLAAEEAAAKAEADRIAAEEKAAADAAAAAEAARLAAEEAARQAEADKQAAAEAARQAAIAEQQKMSVMAAITAASDAVAALMDDSSDADVAAAMAEIAKATAAIAAASSFSEADMMMYNAQVTAIQADMTLAEANIRAYRAEMAAQDAMNQATAADRAKTAVQNAIAALTAAGEAEDMASATYSDAADTLEAAQQAVADADADMLADASAALAEALIAASTAAADLGVKTQAVADATAALMAARTALAEADPDHVALQAANMALEQAQMDKDELTKQVEALQARIDKLIEDQKQAEQDRMDEADRMAEEQRMKDMAAKGKALHRALGGDPLSHLRSDGDTPLAAIGAPGLTLGVPTDGSETAAEDLVPTMMAVDDSEGMLGDWKSMKYLHTDAGTKMTHEAMVYTNQDDPEMKAFATGASFGTDQGTFDAAYNADTRTLTLGNLDATDDVEGDDFPTAGSKTYEPDPVTNVVVVRGSYQGAMGNYRCTGDACSAAVATAGLDLSDGWVFIHDSGAMVSIPDSAYVFFGWWLHSDADGPAAASAFHGEVDDVEGAGTFTDPMTLGGSAKYVGKAAGKWAINHPINGGDAGHFTADATLTATFSANTTATGGVTGTINNFMANDEEVPWSVKLNRAGWTNATGALGDVANPAGDDSLPDIVASTVWSIDGIASTASGSWTGQMYDEALAPASVNDGSNVPTTITGVFQSMFGSDHTMVGAFGAEN